VRDAVVRERVDWVLGFNPVPWGSLALLGAAGTQARVALSMIGRDALQVKKLWAAPFREALRRADAVTVTGDKMGREIAKFGVRPERVHVLPHSVDLARFRPSAASDPAPAFDVISVGQLIRRKRMDVLITAVALSRDQGAPVRLAILGRGPEKASLERLARQLGVEGLVTFLEYRDDVEVALRSARAFALVSEWEGVPFALMEAMATGLVPIVTDVGTISDWVRSGENGLIVPVRHAPAVARAFISLFYENLELRASLERRLLEERERLSIESGVRVWESIFERRDG
jgi:glycosyltransferase involved in cell wall biosynthesis